MCACSLLQTWQKQGLWSPSSGNKEALQRICQHTLNVNEDIRSQGLYTCNMLARHSDFVVMSSGIKAV